MREARTTRFVVLLRGASPQNCAMSQLRACLEAARFARVTTVLSSGNAAFDARDDDEGALVTRLAALFTSEFGRDFYPIVRRTSELAGLVASDPFGDAAASAGAKRVVSFLRSPRPSLVPLPLSQDGATLLFQRGREGFTTYVPSDKGPVFMKLIERAWGKEVTTRTWETVCKCARA
jgi:uncharacterized protein (DUF1697 family)